jgi:hypothetical protein
MKTFLNGVALTLLTFFSPVFPILIAVAVAIFADTVFGIQASIKKGVPYKSKILRITILNKLIKYHLAIISFFIIDKLLLNEILLNYFPNVEFTLTKILGIGLCWIELTSINESTQVLYEKSLFERIRGFVRGLKLFKKDFDELKD